MSTGSDLEAAVASAARHYRDADRCELAKQHTPRLHSGVYQGKAAIDFKGWYGPARQPIYVECKATSDGKIEFRDVGDGIREKQLEAMRDAVQRGIHMILIADFVNMHEVYVIDVKRVVDFAASPWRKSLSFAWCRAYGELAKVNYDAKGRPQRVWFLDTRPSEFQATATIAIIAERAQYADAPRVELFPAEVKPRKRRVNDEPMPAPGSEAYRQRIIDSAQVGVGRQLGARRRKWNPR